MEKRQDGQINKILKSLLIWLCFIPLAVLNGGLREYVLNDMIGKAVALPLSGISLSLLIMAVSTIALPRLGRFSLRESILTGSLWAVLTVAFELSLWLTGGGSCAGFISANNPLTGNLWLLVVTSTFLSPIIINKWHKHT